MPVETLWKSLGFKRRERVKLLAYRTMMQHPDWSIIDLQLLAHRERLSLGDASSVRPLLTLGALRSVLRPGMTLIQVTAR